jgi:hypothetical protein
MSVTVTAARSDLTLPTQHCSRPLAGHILTIPILIGGFMAPPPQAKCGNFFKQLQSARLNGATKASNDISHRSSPLSTGRVRGQAGIAISYRLREQRRTGLLKAPAIAPSVPAQDDQELAQVGKQATSLLFVTWTSRSDRASWQTSLNFIGGPVLSGGKGPVLDVG